MTWDPTYEREGDWLAHSYRLGTGNVLRIAAKDVRKERGRTYATINISMNWVSLAYSDFNLDRDEDRVRLANSAYSHLEGEDHALDREEFPKNLLKHALDMFTSGLWDEVIGHYVGGLLQGDRNRKSAEPIVGNYIYKESGTIIFAPPGATKSYNALLLDVSAAWDVKLFGPSTMQP